MKSRSEFQVGDRVRLNSLGKSRARNTPETGKVVNLPGGLSVEVIFDGNRTPTRIHRSYIEAERDVAAVKPILPR
jgi:hypothetical protein